mgnify:CR=1 FL=1
MQPRRSALGRGLDSLISMDDTPARGSSAINEIALDKISPNPSQPRTTFSDESLEELAASIRELGIIQPLSLRKTGPDSYQIIAGERRFRAARLAGLESVPAYIRTASDSELTEMALIENIQREDLNAIATRAMAVLNPVKVVITNYPEGQTEMVEMENNPEDPTTGTHQMPFSREIYIERDDFMENPPKKFFRLAPDSEVRLKGAYIVKCTGVKKNDAGEIEEIYCTYDPESRSGMPGASRKVKGTLHWVSAATAVDATVRLYDRLFSVENPSAETDRDFRELLNPDSLIEVKGVKLEPFIAENARKGEKFQFQRVGYFTPDYDSTPDNLIFNCTIALKDSWEKAQKK